MAQSVTQIARFDALLDLVTTVTPANTSIADIDAVMGRCSIFKRPAYQRVHYLGVDINRHDNSCKQRFPAEQLFFVGQPHYQLIFVYSGI